ncbi:MAG: hypothetical protein NT144_09015 [Bacteroidia bacterium]|nr:hypothetical protein [Bacteroidia bacterium]
MKDLGLALLFKLKIISALIIMCMVLLLPDKSFSQSYGLGFNGQDYSKDLRTGIDLSPGNYFKLDNEFELSFKMLLRPNVKMYFGYIVRIIDKNGRNIDLIFNYKSVDLSSIVVVCSQNISRILLNTDLDSLCNK